MVTKTVQAPAGASTVNVTNSPEVVQALKDFAEARDDMKAAEVKKKAAEKIIRAAAGDAQTLILRGVVAARISDPRTRSSFDSDILREAFPEAAAASLKETTYTVLTVS